MLEIERKFLMKSDMLEEFQFPQDSKINIIDQGYLMVGDPEIRVRRKGDKHFLTVKSGNGLTREEKELSISRETFDALIRQCEYCVSKHRISFDRWEIDRFHGALKGLILVEIELGSEAEMFVFPEWLSANLVKEVTYDERYKNQNLAQFGIPHG